MTTAEKDLHLLEQLIAAESLQVDFQPIFSLRQRGIVGLEALSRGIHPETGERIAPTWLFDVAKQTGNAVALDRACRSCILRAFEEIAARYPQVTLFLNFESAVLNEITAGSGSFFKRVNDFGLNPQRIVIEVVESKVDNLSTLNDFVTYYRGHGFLVALDDIGSGHSNLERISVIKPDVMKIDRSIIQGVETEYYKQEIFKSLVNLGHKLGAIIVAEGMETEEQALSAVDLGADLLQGYYLARPGTVTENKMSEASTHLAQLTRSFRIYTKRKNAEVRREKERFARFCSEVLPAWALDEEEADLNRRLERLVQSQDNVECVYALNCNGLQISDTVFHPDERPDAGRFIFAPAREGTDHSLKEYFVKLRDGWEDYLTEPYISLASGRLCRTLSVRLRRGGSDEIVLCVDFHVGSVPS